ncbi:MAG: hypothetical protein ACPF9D_08200 [Owenweeksia sp.]
MKKKGQMVILAPLVLIIWGVIGYRIYKAVKGNSEVSVVTAPVLPAKKAEVETKAYELALNYDDPFLKNTRRYVPPPVNNGTPAPAAAQRNKPKVIKTVTKIPVQWPKVVYHGLISHKGDKTTLFLVVSSLDSVSWPHFMEVGDVSNDLKLLKAFPDSIWMTYKEEDKKTFIKEP